MKCVILARKSLRLVASLSCLCTLREVHTLSCAPQRVLPFLLEAKDLQRRAAGCTRVAPSLMESLWDVGECRPACPMMCTGWGWGVGATTAAGTCKPGLGKVRLAGIPPARENCYESEGAAECGCWRPRHDVAEAPRWALSPLCVPGWASDTSRYGWTGRPPCPCAPAAPAPEGAGKAGRWAGIGQGVAACGRAPPTLHGRQRVRAGVGRNGFSSGSCEARAAETAVVWHSPRRSEHARLHASPIGQARARSTDTGPRGHKSWHSSHHCVPQPVWLRRVPLHAPHVACVAGAVVAKARHLHRQVGGWAGGGMLGACSCARSQHAGIGGRDPAVGWAACKQIMPGAVLRLALLPQPPCHPPACPSTRPTLPTPACLTSWLFDSGEANRWLCSQRRVATCCSRTSCPFLMPVPWRHCKQ